jgi:hypothetical protein
LFTKQTRADEFAMSKADEFQRHAEKCQEMATREPEPGFRSSWLGMARTWLFLLEQERRWSAEHAEQIPHSGRTPRQQFN